MSNSDLCLKEEASAEQTAFSSSLDLSQGLLGIEGEADVLNFALVESARPVFSFTVVDAAALRIVAASVASIASSPNLLATLEQLGLVWTEILRFAVNA